MGSGRHVGRRESMEGFPILAGPSAHAIERHLYQCFLPFTTRLFFQNAMQKCRVKALSDDYGNFHKQRDPRLA